jgi:hypothetical protein
MHKNSRSVLLGLAFLILPAACRSTVPEPTTEEITTLKTQVQRGSPPAFVADTDDGRKIWSMTRKLCELRGFAPCGLRTVSTPNGRPGSTPPESFKSAPTFMDMVIQPELPLTPRRNNPPKASAGDAAMYSFDELEPVYFAGRPRHQVLERWIRLSSVGGEVRQNGVVAVLDSQQRMTRKSHFAG